jgi:hypothetical protein
MARAPDGTEQEIWNDVTGISSGSWSKIESGLREQCQLEVRLVTQTTSDEGIEETDWTAISDKNKWRMLRIMIGPSLAWGRPLTGAKRKGTWLDGAILAFFARATRNGSKPFLQWVCFTTPITSVAPSSVRKAVVNGWGHPS